MVAAHDRRGGVASEKVGKPTQSTPHTRPKWVAPTWKRLDTPMEVTMYVGRR
jgi:hypothetical protein